MATQLVTASVVLYKQLCTGLMPTPAKSHYTFNLRDLRDVVGGMIVNPQISTEVALGKLFVHEAARVFQDRLICKEDRDWYTGQMKSVVENHLKLRWSELMPAEAHHPLLFCNFMATLAVDRVYEEIEDMPKLRSVCERHLGTFNSIAEESRKLVLFVDAIAHLCRISRVISQVCLA